MTKKARKRERSSERTKHERILTLCDDLEGRSDKGFKIAGGVPGDLFLYQHARLILIEKSVSRNVKAPCVHFEKCGACQWMDISYSQQLLLKDRFIREQFSQYTPTIASLVASENSVDYRNKLILPFHYDESLGRHVYGFYLPHTNVLSEIESCLLQSNLQNQIIRKLRDLIINDCGIHHLIIREANSQKLIQLCIVTDRDEDLTASLDPLLKQFPEIVELYQLIQSREKNSFNDLSQARLLYQRFAMTDEFEGIQFPLKLGVFYQINRFQMKKIYLTVASLLQKLGAKRILETYCGMGVLARYLSDYVEYITATDNNPANIKTAKKLAENRTNMQIICEDALDSIHASKAVDTIIVNPPRKGLSPTFIKVCAAKKINAIIYISCSAKSLLRDLKLVEAEGYQVDSLQAFDMFPHTHHVEILAVIKRKI